MEAPVSLSRIVVFPAFARPMIRTLNSKYRIFQNDKSSESEISPLEDDSVSDAIECSRTKGGSDQQSSHLHIYQRYGSSHVNGRSHVLQYLVRKLCHIYLTYINAARASIVLQRQPCLVKLSLYPTPISYAKNVPAFAFLLWESRKSGAGKSTLINAVFGIDATPVAHQTPGEHDINEELSFPENTRIVIHDSQGFEAGEEANIRKVLDFIDRRSEMPALGDRLHVIWICAEIPFAGGRMFERGVERILKECRGNVPIIVVFTKLDILREHRETRLEKELEQRGDDMDDEKFDAKVEIVVNEDVWNLCVKPLHALTPSDCPKYSWIATSNGHELRFKKTIAELVNLTLELTKIENVWIEMAIAQRSHAKASIEASIRIGRKHYWRGLFSDIFLGVTMRTLLDVLQKDIVNVWNMEDPKDYLKQPEFLALLSVLVEDLSDEDRNNYPLTERVVQSIVEHPAALVITGPTAIIVLFAEWVRGTYRKTKNSLRCLMGFLVDLTLTMDTLFYLVLSRGQKAMKIGFVNRALQIYKTRKTPVHASIRAWADGWGTFSHLDAGVVINKISDIIEEHSVKPEQWEMRDDFFDESWMAMDALRETET